MFDFVEIYKNAILEEYNYVKKHVTRIPLFDGKYLYMAPEGFVYTFTSEKELAIPDSTPVVVYNCQQTITGEVMYINGDEVVLCLKKKIETSAKTEFSSSVHELLLKLIDRISEIDYERGLVKDLIFGANALIADKEIKKGQQTAIQYTTKNPITLIWGPPGTGKTYTLAEIAWKFYQQGNSVLIVSQSNIAVDNAMLAIKERASLDDEGKIFRAGYSKLKAIMDRVNENDIYINARQYVEKTNPDLIKRLEQAQKDKKKEKNPDRLKLLNETIKRIRREIADIGDRLIYQAKIIGTTISKATADKKIYMRNYDVVLFDEASMAYVPQIVYACSLARKNFVCIGDFRQLPPIVQSSETNILNKDIFHYLSVFDGIRFRNHKWLIMLNEQRRMAPQISEFVKSKIYKNELINHESVFTSREDIIKKSPVEGFAVGYFNTDHIFSSALSKQVNFTASHYNLVSAFLSVLIAIQAKKNGQKNIAIIAPYKHQVNLIKSILADSGVSKNEWHGITCSTIHQFQGRESNMIIFDSVDGDPMQNLGKMLRNGDDTDRLVNVAITRARGKFIFIGSRMKASKSGILEDLWGYLKQTGREITFEEIENMQDFHLLLSEKKGIIGRELLMSGSVLAMLNKSVVDDVDFLSVLNKRTDMAENLCILMDSKLLENEETLILGRLSKPAIKGKVFKSLSLSMDSFIGIDEKIIWIPIYDKVSKKKRYLRFEGKRTYNTIKDLELEERIKEKNMGLRAVVAKAEIVEKWIICPRCSLNMMLEGQICCNICMQEQNKPQEKMDIPEKNRVSRYEILLLWCQLTGKNIKFFYKSSEGQAIVKMLRNNSKIKRMIIDKEYYFDKNDVFFEFFKTQPLLKEVIKKMGIFDYDDLVSRKWWIHI